MQKRLCAGSTSRLGKAHRATNPDRYYRAADLGDRLKELGGFAATLKLVMTMQWVPARRQPEWQARLRRRTLVLAMLVIVGLAAPLLALAEGHPLRTRTRPVARPAGLAHTDRVRSSSVAGRKSAQAVAKKPTRHTSGKSVGKPAKGGTRAKTRRHVQPAEESEPVLKLRAKAETRRERAVGKHVARNRRMQPVVPERDAAPVAEAASKPLTVDDFMLAADGSSTSSGEAFAQGQSHPEDAVSVVVVRPPVKEPVVLRAPAVVARLEPNRGSLPRGLTQNAPSDLVGAPLATVDRVPAHEMTTTNRTDLPSVRLPPPTRQELTEAVEQPLVLPGLYRNGRLVMPAPLKGTREILVHQNVMADDEGLERIEDDDDLRRLRAAHLLVDFPESASLHVNGELGANRRCARAWTVRFAAEIGRAYYARFHEPLQVNSAVRTVAYQRRLQRTNGNAAAIDGEAASPHLTGQAMDLGKRGMSMAQIAWMRAYLLPLMQAGKIDVEEEFQQACFHISVYRSYLPSVPTRRVRSEVAQLRGEPKIVKASPRGDDLQ